MNDSGNVAAVGNPAGNFILPSIASTEAAAQSISNVLPDGTGDWSTVSILNTSGAQAYPIVQIQWLLVDKELNASPGMDLNNATQLGAVAMVPNPHRPNPSCTLLLLCPAFPPNMVQADEATINSITFNGQTLQTHLEYASDIRFYHDGTVNFADIVYFVQAYIQHQEIRAFLTQLAT